jgi:hypothetical protein
VVFDGSPFSSGRAVPQWDKGYLLSLNFEITDPTQWAVRWYGANGIPAGEATLWIPGSVRILLNGAAMTGQGEVVVAGVAEHVDGARAFFLAITDRAGGLKKVLRTNPYHVSQLCAAPDGTVWTFGVASPGPGEVASDAPTLRQHDFEKGELTALLPRSTFQTRLNPSATRGVGNSVAFACGADRVAIYSEVAGEFIEVMYSTLAVSRWRIERHPNDAVLSGTRLAVTSSGDVYAVLREAGLQKDGSRGLFGLQRRPAGGTVHWSPVLGEGNDPGQEARISNIFGVDGDSLVFQRAFDRPAVQWARFHN